MPSNNPDYQRRYHAAHHSANKVKYKAQATLRRQQFREEIQELKRQPCMDCGHTFNPWQMDFDHRDGSKKEGDISKLVACNQRSRAYAEIAKCDLVCANCHRDRTYRRLYAPVVSTAA